MDIPSARSYSPSSTFKDKVAQLSAAIDEGTRKVSITDQCLPMIVVIGAIVPFAAVLILFLTRPSFVKNYDPTGRRLSGDDEGNKSSIGVKKLLWYTTLISMFTWCVMYVANIYKAFDRMTMACVV
jgi:hypothetical protein